MSQRYIGGLIYNPPGGFSGYFDGSGDYLTLASSSNLALGSGDFTLEFWVYSLNNTSGSDKVIFDQAASNTLLIYIESTDGSFVVRDYGVSNIFSIPSFPVNFWTHVALSRASNTLRLFINGAQVGSTSNSTNLTQNGTTIGRFNSGGEEFNGYISNLRLVKGTAVYTSAFNPPSGQLQAVTNTQLLTCAYSTFRDGSSNSFAITVNGNTVVSTQNPFPLTTLPNPALGNQGNGIYTMSQYQSLLSQNLWPSIDPYFKNVTLLLHGNGTNGAQNNSFVDSSTNNFSITRNGDTTQGTFSPFSQTGWSNYFDGSSQYLSVADSADFDFGGGDFTVEYWEYRTAAKNDVTPINRRINISGSNNSIWMFGYEVSGNLSGYFNNGAGTIYLNISMGAALYNSWNHYAIVRSGNTVTIYRNGTNIQTGSLTQTLPAAGQPISIGRMQSGYDFNGYISNVRLVKGVAVYTGNFTLPTSPLTATQSAGTNIAAITGTQTSLLTCQSNRFIDNSASPKTITVNGNVSVQAFSPFQPTAAYSASTNGGSGYFDGSGDYLSFSAVSVGTSAFTFECWVYTSAANTLQLTFGAPSINPTGGLSIQLLSNGTTVQLDSYTVSNQQFTIPTRTAQSWNHLAVCRDGSNNCTVFWNGTRSSTGSVTNTTNYSGGFGNIGANGGFEAFTGYISGARAVIGSSVYDPTQSSITVPTSPPTAVSNTKLLLNFTNAGIIDNTAKNDLVTVGNAQISTAQSKFGGASMYFDGSGDFVQTFASNQDLAFRTGNFTVECWVYFNTSGQHGILQLSTNPGGFNTSNTNSIAMQRSGTGQWEIYAKSTNPSASATINQSQWYHLAIVRNGTTTTFYVDGVSTITVTSDSTDYTGTYIGLGAIYSTGVPLNGYIDDLRITKGIARYTTNFTPQRSQWQDQ